ncbi:MAG: putative glycoside hydrolase [Candidatus Tenebribacter mawsonii]|nr:putative glycoside hydrolase [Candidatus Tenebribacter mawsonii]
MKIRYLLLFLFLVTISCSEKKGNKINNEIEHEIVKLDTLKQVIQPEEKIINIEQPIQDFTIKKEYEKFTKGIYLTAYTINTPKFYTLLDSAESAGINTLIFDLKNMNGHVFFRMPQKGFLESENIKPIINIAKVVKAAHKQNMRAVARVVMFHDQLTAQRDSLMRPENVDGGYWLESKRKKASWLDSSNLEVQHTLLLIIEEIAKKGIDEIQMDYVRFPTQGNISEAIFAFQREDTSLAQKDSTYVPRQKSDIIKQFVSQAKMICDKYNVTLTADVFAIVSWQRPADINATGQDIKKMTQHLDAIHPMIYSSHFNKDFGFRKDIPNEPYFIVYKGSILSKKHANSECRVIPYIQSNSWKVNYGYGYITAQIQAVIDSGSDGYILWNASNRYYQTLRWIREFDNTD